MKEKASLAFLVRFFYLQWGKFSGQLISYTEVNSLGWLECKDQYKHYSRKLNDHLLRQLCYWVVPKRLEIQAGAKTKKIDGTRKISVSGPHNINHLLTERESRTGKYWPEVVAVRTGRSEIRTATTKQARLASCLLCGARILVVKWTACIGFCIKSFQNFRIIKLAQRIWTGFINWGVDNLNFTTVESLKKISWRFERWRFERMPGGIVGCVSL